MPDVAILGGSGYTGGELIRILLSHPRVTLGAVSSRHLAGKPLAQTFPWLEGRTDLRFVTPDEVVGGSADLVFTALGHMESVESVARLMDKGKKVVDLSADFRFAENAFYTRWYNQDHPRPDLLSRAVYGLPEHYRSRIAGSLLTANPGCYATACILSLLPLAARGILPPGVVIDAKSGVSGAGRNPKDNTVFPECNEGLRPYAVARHRHQPEIEMVLGEAGRKPAQVLFTPHLLPANRGILASVYLPLPAPFDQVVEIYRDHYRDEPFVKVKAPRAVPGVQDVRGSNYCHLGLVDDPSGKFLLVFSVIDNLVKGASGQAVQNMNLMLGLPETAGLGHFPLAP
jgi:N-acetyl-gamma-glutamyl-phosphate reductase